MEQATAEQAAVVLAGMKRLDAMLSALQNAQLQGWEIVKVNLRAPDGTIATVVDGVGQLSSEITQALYSAVIASVEAQRQALLDQLDAL